MALNNIRRQAPQPGKLVKVVLGQLAGSPAIWCEHIGDTNVGFTNDTAKGVGGIKIGNPKSTPVERQRNRDANRETVIKHSAKKLEGFFYDDDHGGADPARPVPSTPEGVAEAIMSLPDDVFDLLLMTVLNADNYRDVVSSVPVDELAKKS